MQSFDSLYSTFGGRVADLPGFGTNWGSFAELGMHQYEESVRNATLGLGFNPNEHYGGRPGSRFTGYGLIYGNGTRVGGSWAYGEAVGHMEGGETLSLNWDDSTDDPTMIAAAVSSGDCLNAIYNAVPANLLSYAKTAIPALDNATTGNGYTWAQFAYLLASTEHESAFGSLMEEIWGPTPDQQGYEPQFDNKGNVTNKTAKDLGNNVVGDGKRYRGRGYVQITGRGNYARFSDVVSDLYYPAAFPLVLEAFPEQAELPSVAAVIAAQGLQNDLFKQRGRKIGDVIDGGTFNEFLSARDFIGARYVMQGSGKNRKKVDVGTKIANRAIDYLNAMKGNCF